MGSLLDTYGTWITSVLAGLLFSSGFSLFAFELGRSSDSPFQTLVACFFLAGVGTAAS
jgi:hypothetical protein